jgi:hypothetical protein
VLGHSQLNRFVENCKEGISTMWHAKATTSFETCLVSTHRSIKFAEKLFVAGYERPRGRDVFTDSVRDLLRSFRDSIQHFDNDIANGKFPSGFSSCICPKVAQLEIAKVRPGTKPENLVLAYADLGDWLRQLHAFAVGLLEEYTWKPPDSPPPTGPVPDQPA